MGLAQQNQHGQLTLTCPICRQVTPVPASGVAGLQSDFRTNQLMESFKEELKKVKAGAETTSTSASPHQNITTCPEHGEKEDLFCKTCKRRICSQCILKGEKHYDHKYVYKRYKAEIRSYLEDLEDRLMVIDKALGNLDACQGEIANQEAVIESDIHNSIARLHETLDVRKAELIDQLHELTQTKSKILASQRDQIESIQAQLKSCFNSIGESLEAVDQAEQMVEDTMIKQAKELTSKFHPDSLQLNTQADMIFAILKDLSTECQNYGLVSTTDTPDPSQCYATGKGLETAVVGESSTILLETLNFNKENCNVPINSITCDLIPSTKGNSARGTIVRRQSLYEISYQPTVKGKHQLHIKVEGQHIRGSPFSINAVPEVEVEKDPNILQDEGMWLVICLI